MSNKLEIYLLGVVPKRIESAVQLLSNMVYGAGNRSEERVYFESAATQLFSHNITKIATGAYEIGSQRPIVEFSDMSDICKAIEETLPGVNIKQALN